MPGKDSGDMMSGKNERVVAALLAERLRTVLGRSQQDPVMQGPSNSQSADQQGL
jgi:hypothetical protein